MITLDPSTEFSNSIIVLNNVYETLTRYVDGKLEPLLATEWSANEDGTMWTFKLRKNVKFHDGAELTSEAVKFSIERTIRLAGGPAYIWDSVHEIETPDPYTVVLSSSILRTFRSLLQLAMGPSYSARRWLRSEMTRQSRNGSTLATMQVQVPTPSASTIPRLRWS